ncbi:MAG: C39 family peptidase [Candidatus Magasanikbacteria bacterium]|nr:C39 family peptidase [Candidatus Magasanikbacteria bacterium]
MKTTALTFAFALEFLLIPVLSAQAAESINLSVPYIPEAPEGLMVKPWNNSCEEASTAMLDEYYFGNRNKGVTKAKAKQSILYYIDVENKLFGYNGNTDAAEMVKVINEYSKYFEAKIKTNPTLEEIKDELGAGRPVIALLYGKLLNNPRIQFARNGSYYHTFVIKGFDDEKEEFIVNDNGDLKQGLDLRYLYDTIMGALRDYDHKTSKTVKPATVLFTSQRMLVKTKDSGRIYLIKDNKKYHVSSPQVFKDRKWRWSFVMVVEKSWLDKFQAGAAI